MAVAALAAQYNLAVANQAQITAVFAEPDPAPATATIAESWAATLRVQRHALAAMPAVQALVPLAVAGNMVGLLGPLANAQLSLQNIITRVGVVTGVPDGDPATPITAALAALTPQQYKVDAGNNTRRLASRYTAALLQALIAAAQPAPAAPLPPQVQPVNVVPTFVGKVPEFSGEDSAAFRAWRIRVTNLVTAQLNALPTDRIVGLKVQEGLTGSAAIAANTLLPQPQIGTPNDDASKTAYLEAIMNWIRDAFGNPNEIAEAGKAFNILRQKDQAFGPFFVQFQELRTLAGLAPDPASIVNDLRGKISPALRNYPFITAEVDHDTLIAQCRLYDPIVRAAAAATASKRERTAAPAQTQRIERHSSVPIAAGRSSLQLPKAQYEVLQRARRFEWPEEVPDEFRGRMTEELRALLTDADRCWFCRVVGHESYDCPKKQQLGLNDPERTPAASRSATPAPLEQIREQARLRRDNRGRFRTGTPAASATTSVADPDEY